MTRSEFKTLAIQRILRLDGATGTELAKRGMPPGVCPEAWILDNPDAIIDVQRCYAAAGSDIVYAPTFGGNPLKLAEFGLADRTEEINRELARLSRRAVPDKFVFADIAPTGQLIEPYGELAFDEAVEIYKRQIRALLESGGIDGFAIETMMDLQEARAALIAVRELSELPALVTLTFEPGGRTLTGVHPVSALVTLQGLGADAFGCNCSTGPEAMAGIIRSVKPYAKIPLAAKPNAGMPHLVDGETRFDLGPEAFAASAAALVGAGASLIGGCCGTTPEHIRLLSEAIGNSRPRPVSAEKRGIVASPGRFRRIAADEPFALIGERINPTGKKALQAELRAGCLDLVRQFAREQSAQGAALLDVNFGLSGIDEAATMRRAVGELVLTTDTPLCIDSTNPEAVEAGLRIYPGRALFNSISLEEERIDTILPIAAKYGAMLVLLPLTEEGIPATAADRLSVLGRIVEHARKYGYTSADFVADALIMTISANPEAAGVSLDFIEKCRREAGINTICGLSNVSFGLPNRAVVNQTFLGMALGRGLTSAIANPAAPGIMDTIAAGDALGCRDRRLERFLERFGSQPAAPAGGGGPAEQDVRPPEERMFDAVLRGRRETALELLDELIAANADPGAIVNRILIPAITEVGERFERKEYFLPQLMQSAAAMQKAMEKLEPLLRKEGGGSDGPVFVLATVKGDIHDIGKNIVSLLFRNHNFRVIDLGKDVPAETIIDTAVREKAALIGLSALMTTTMPQMKVVIDLARERGLDIPILVGGAAVDEAFAESIGAVYGADAMAAVRNASKLLGL